MIEQIRNSYGKCTEREILEMYQTADLALCDTYCADNSLLHLAAEWADAQAIAILLDRGIDVNVANRYNQRPLHLLAKGVARVERDSAAIKASAQLLLDAKASTMRKDDEGKTAVIWAAAEGRCDILETMIEKGVKMTSTDREGNTALHVVCQNLDLYPERHEDYVKAVELLLAAGFEADEKNNYDQTAIEFAREQGDKQVVAILIGEYDADGADDAALKAAGLSLVEAAEQGDLEAVSANIERGAAFDELSDSSDFPAMTALAIAVQKLNVEMVKVLLEGGAAVNFKTGDGKTALSACLGYRADRYFDFAASEAKSIERIFRLLQAHGLDLDDNIDDEGNTALIKACAYIDRNSSYNGKTLSGSLAKLLIAAGADVNLSNLKGQTALMLLSTATRSEVADLHIEMLEADAAVDAVDRDGNTVLMYTARNSEYGNAKEMAELLFDFGDPKPDAVNNAGQTALEIATEMDNEMLVKLLLMNM